MCNLRKDSGLSEYIKRAYASKRSFQLHHSFDFSVSDFGDHDTGRHGELDFIVRGAEPKQ